MIEEAEVREKHAALIQAIEAVELKDITLAETVYHAQKVESALIAAGDIEGKNEKERKSKLEVKMRDENDAIHVAQQDLREAQFSLRRAEADWSLMSKLTRILESRSRILEK